MFYSFVDDDDDNGIIDVQVGARSVLNKIELGFTFKHIAKLFFFANA